MRLLQGRLTPGAWRSCRKGCGLSGQGELVLERGELAKAALAAAVEGVLDPEHDGLVHLIAAASVAAAVRAVCASLAPSPLCDAVHACLEATLHGEILAEQHPHRRLHGRDVDAVPKPARLQRSHPRRAGLHQRPEAS